MDENKHEVKSVDAESDGYWQVEYDLSKGQAPETAWGPIETCSTMTEAHERARARAELGQKTRVVFKTGGRVVTPSRPVPCEAFDMSHAEDVPTVPFGE